MKRVKTPPIKINTQKKKKLQGKQFKNINNYK